MCIELCGTILIEQYHSPPRGQHIAMESRMEHQLQLRLLGSARAALADQERPGEHLHYDRAAHVWRAHDELDRPGLEPAALEAEAVLAGCAQPWQ
jgi:hypothetical protein